MTRSSRKISRTIKLAKHTVRIKRADGGETDPMLDLDVTRPQVPDREWGPAITPEQAFSAPKEESKPSLTDRAFSTVTGGRNLENDVRNLRERLPDTKEYGTAVQHAVNEARQMQNLGVENMKSGQVGQSVLGAAQVPLGYFNQAIAPVTGAFELASQAAGRFDPRLKAEADVIGLLGTEGSGALSKTARAASDFSNYVPAATLATAAIPAKAGEAERAVQAAKEVTPRSLSDLGFYSHGAETAANLPQAKGQSDQMISMLRNAGVKPAELENAGLIDATGAVHPDWAGKSVTRDELSQHLAGAIPELKETIIGKSLLNKDRQRMFELEEKQARGKISPEEQEEYLTLYRKEGKDINEGPKFGKYTLPNGDNYRELALSLPGEEIYRVPMAHAMNEDADVNRLAHIRMSDRTGPNNEKLLHIEELQSDWGQEGRDEGFVNPELQQRKQELSSSIRDIMAQVRAESDKIHAQYEQDSAPYKGAYRNAIREAENKFNKSRQLYSDINEYNQAAEKAEAEAMAAFGDVRNAAEAKRKESFKQLSNTYNKPLSKLQDEYSKIPKDEGSVTPAPYVTSTQGWTDLALKRIMKEAAEGGYDGIVFTPGSEQAKRYPGMEEKAAQGLQKFYDNIVTKRVQELAKQHDKEVKLGQAEIPNAAEVNHDAWLKKLPETQDMSFTQRERYWGSLSVNERLKLLKEHKELFTPNSITGFHIPMTDKMRQSILSGQKAFAEGGRVGFADGGAPWDTDLSTNPFEYKPTQGSNVPLANMDLYKGAALNTVPEVLPEKKVDTTTGADTTYQPEGSGGGSGSNDPSSTSPALSSSTNTSPASSPAPAPEATPSATNGLGGFLSGKVQSAIDNPLSTAVNLGIGFVPGVGMLNTLSGIVGGPTVGGMVSPGKDKSTADKATIGKISASDEDTTAAQSTMGGALSGGLNTGISDATGLSSDGSGGAGAGGGGSGGASGGGSGGAGSGGSGSSGSSGTGTGTGTGVGVSTSSADAEAEAADAAEAAQAEAESEAGSESESESGNGEGESGGGEGPGGGEAGVKRGGAITARRYRASGGPINLTEKQEDAGNYKKKHVNFQGIPVSVEVGKGHVREKIHNKKVLWKEKMPTDYGYVRGTEDNDHMESDVFVGKHKKSDKVWVIDQGHHHSHKFDEHKAMLGFKSKHHALKEYKDSFKGGKKPKHINDVTEMTVDQYKHWLKRGDLKKPVASSPLIHKALSVVSKKT